MLASPKAVAFVRNFAGQWLFLRNLDASAPVQSVFPDFDDALRQGFRRETELFVESIVREDRSALDLLRADYTFVNERLARHYGLPNIRGSHFRRVTLPPANPRRGLLGQGSVLTVTSYPDRTSPVVRGKWILENLLGTPPPPPLPNVPPLKATDERPGAVDAAADGAASRQPGVRELPRDDGPAGPLARELRRRRQVARARRVVGAHRRHRPAARRDAVRGAGRAARRAVALGPLRGDTDGEDAHLRPRPRARVLRRAGRARDPPPGGAARLPDVGPGGRCRDEHAVPHAPRRRGGRGGARTNGRREEGRR